MKIKIRWLISFFLVSYTFFGLAISAVLSLSKFGFVSAIFGAGMMVLWFLFNGKKIPSFVLLYLLAYVYICFTYVWSYEEGYSFLGGVLTVGSASIFIGLALVSGHLSPRNLVIIMMVPSLVNIIAYFLGVNYVTEIYDISDEAGMRRFGGYVGHPNALLTRMMAPLFIVIVFINYFYKSKSENNYIVLTSILFAFFSVYITGSKKALVLICVALIVLQIWYYRVRVLSVWVLGAFFSFVYAAGGIVSDSNIEVLIRFQNMLSGDESTSERFYMLVKGFELFVESPVIGEGVNSFSYLSGLGYYSHNNLVEVLVTGGALGFVLYYFPYALACYASVYSMRLLYVFFMVLMFLVFDFTSVSYLDRGIQVVFISFMVCYLYKGTWYENSSINR